MTFQTQIPAEALQHLTMTDEEARSASHERKRTFYARTVPALRLVGLGGGCALVAAIEYSASRSPWNEVVATLVVTSLAYTLLATLASWWLYSPAAKVSAPTVALKTDMAIGGLMVFVTGGVASPLFFMPYIRVFDHVLRGSRACLEMLAVAQLVHVSVILGHASYYGSQISLSTAVIQVASCAVMAFYMSLVGGTAQQMRSRSQRTVTIARQLIRELQASAVELELARRDAEAASEAKGQFLANITHELRTPLNGIIGMSELARSTNLQDESEEYLDSVLSSADALLTIVDDILDLSKLDTGDLKAECKPFDLRETVRVALHTTSETAFAKGLDITCHVDPDLPHLVLGDGTYLRQVLVKLMDNAIKFTSEGMVQVSLSVDASEPCVRIEVRDTGIGIPADDHDRVFQAFTQVEQSLSRRFGGTGLGLATSRCLCEAMGGDLNIVESGPQGTTMRISIPLGTASEQAEEAAAIGSGETVVVVAEVEAVGESFCAGLERHGFGTWLVTEPKELRGVLSRKEAAWRGAVIAAVTPRDTSFGNSLESAAQELHGHRWVRIEQGASRSWAAPSLHAAKTVRAPIVCGELAHAVSMALAAEAGRGPGATAPSPTKRRTLFTARPMRVLLVEDNPMNQKVARRLLEKWGHDVEVADNGVHALDAVEALEQKSLPFDLILMDLQMPEMDGYTATQEIRKIEMRERMIPTPIVALTANTDAENRDRCYEVGMDEYATKPIQPDRLFTLLETIAGTSAAAKEQAVGPSAWRRSAG